ncbi:MAG: 3'-5' exonuclease, partial [Oscillospiraceae bacterium]
SLGENSREVMASTFHSLCMRILRRDGEGVGYTNTFTIYDSDDQKRVMREVMKDLNIDDKFVQLKVAINRISGYKDKLVSPAEAEKYASNTHEKLILKCYEEYQSRLKKSNALDFDDLIYQTVMLFRAKPEVLSYYQNRYRYIMVDEYQDTSTAQFELISLLSSAHDNLCVVGDDDQSIYRFRGATIENILNFEDNYPKAKVIRLEQNYRSTSNILQAANSVIKNNQSRKGKTLWTSSQGGDKVMLYNLEKEFDEAQNVVAIIGENVRGGAKLSDHAVLYRMNMQSSNMENALARSGIPYRVIGGHRFYDRSEIRDIIAYMYVIINPQDNLRLKRIINMPARKIGATTLAALTDLATEKGVSMIEILYNMYDYPQLSRAATSLNTFLQIYKKLLLLYKTCPMEEFTENLLKVSGYEQMLLEQGEEGKTRLENVGQLISNIKAYKEANEGASLEMFLEEVSLISDIDNYDQNADSVTLMTIHSAKGLEFPYVFLVGVEEGIFPGEMSRYNPDDVEEERRLCYVGITRAKKALYVSYCNERMIFGQTKRPLPSRFVQEMDKEVCEMIDKTPKTPRVSPMNRSTVAKIPHPFDSGSTVAGTQTTKVAQKKSFDVGDVVMHKVFGQGTIIKITPLANDAMLEIVFDTVGTKKVMANYTPITKIE